jgi:hypothetical protein
MIPHSSHSASIITAGGSNQLEHIGILETYAEAT